MTTICISRTYKIEEIPIIAEISPTEIKVDSYNNAFDINFYK